MLLKVITFKNIKSNPLLHRNIIIKTPNNNLLNNNNFNKNKKNNNKRLNHNFN